MLEDILRFIKSRFRRKREYTKQEIDESCARTKMLYGVLNNYGSYTPDESALHLMGNTEALYGHFSGGAVYENYNPPKREILLARLLEQI